MKITSATAPTSITMAQPTPPIGVVTFHEEDLDARGVRFTLTKLGVTPAGRLVFGLTGRSPRPFGCGRTVVHRAIHGA